VAAVLMVGAIAMVLDRAPTLWADGHLWASIEI
jgi:prepilin-type processing-associated H-X9-DG protein